MKKTISILLFSLICCILYFAENLPQGGFAIVKNTSENSLMEYFFVSGQVVYEDNHQPLERGKVISVKLDKETDQIVIFDSATIQSNGYYVLRHIRHDSTYIMAYPDDEDAPIIVPTYYPSAVHWVNAERIYPDRNLSNVDIAVYRSVHASGCGIISGAVFKTVLPNSEGIKDAVIYAKLGSGYKNFAKSSSDGYYYIDSLPMGDYLIFADRIGYYSISRLITLQSSYLDTVNFYLESILIVPPGGDPVPVSYKLNQNYPNPFNPVTTISFEIPATENVKLVIYDMRGKEVAVLLNQNMRAGTYKVNWDASSFSTGIYLYKLSAGTYVETKKMVLLK